MKQPCADKICLHCGHRYRPCCFNAHHQEYCHRVECQRERKRKRDRERYRQKYHAVDMVFCATEKARRSAARQRQSKRAAPVSMALSPEPVLARQVQRLSWMIAGFVEAVSGESDPVFIQELASKYEASGQRLSGGQSQG